MRTKREQAPAFGQVMGSFGRMLRLGMPRWLFCLLGAALIGLGAYGINLITGLLLSTSLTHFTLGTSSLSSVLGLLGVLVACVPVVMAGYILNARTAMGIRARIQRRLVSRWVRQTEAFASRHNSGDAMALVTSDLDIVEDFYFQGLMTTFLIPTVQGLAAAVTVAAADARLLLPPLVTGLLSLLFSMRFAGRVQEKTKAVREETDLLTRTFSEITDGNTAYRTLGMAPEVLNRFRARSDACAEVSAQAAVVRVNITFFAKLMSVLCMLLFFGMGIWLAELGTLDFSLIFLLLPLQSSIGRMLDSLGATWHFLVKAAVSGNRVLDALAWPGEVEGGGTSSVRETGELLLSDLQFGYEPGKPVLRGFSAKVRVGEKLALVGASGCGKSTVLQLLLRFYEPQGGQISLGGVAAGDCSLADWRGAFVLLQQDAPLLAKTIGENIAMGVYGDGREPSRQELVAAAKAAGIHDFIATLPEGYDTPVSEGGKNFSGGQKQRIAIARAFLSAAPIVLLDEPTAALDAESERLVQQSLASLMATRTVIMVAHRLETVRGFDQILLLDGGRVSERGTHEELMALGGQYATLYRTQAQSESKA